MNVLVFSVLTYAAWLALALALTGSPAAAFDDLRLFLGFNALAGTLVVLVGQFFYGRDQFWLLVSAALALLGFALGPVRMVAALIVVWAAEPMEFWATLGGLVVMAAALFVLMVGMRRA